MWGLEHSHTCNKFYLTCQLYKKVCFVLKIRYKKVSILYMHILILNKFARKADYAMHTF